MKTFGKRHIKNKNKNKTKNTADSQLLNNSLV